MPATHNPLTKEIEEIESQKDDMVKVIVEQSLQIKQMEAEMEKMVQEKEKAAWMESTTIEALPLIAHPITTPSSAATGAGSNTEQLARSMESMNL